VANVAVGLGLRLALGRAGTIVIGNGVRRALGPAVGGVILCIGLGSCDVLWDNDEHGGAQMSSDSEERNRQYQVYKDEQRAGYQRDPDHCIQLRNRIEFMKRMVAHRQAWDAAWPLAKYPGGRHSTLNAQELATISLLEAQYRLECPGDC